MYHLEIESIKDISQLNAGLLQVRLSVKMA